MRATTAASAAAARRRPHKLVSQTRYTTVGVVLTNWVDVIKVRQQLAGPGAGRNLGSTCWRIVQVEGVAALFAGLTPAVARGVLYGGECVWEGGRGAAESEVAALPIHWSCGIY